MQVLITGDDPFKHVEGIKVQATARFVGISLIVRSASLESGKLALPCLLANSQQVSGGNVIAKLLVAACGHTLYPQAPYSPDKRYRAAQIDAWLDYSTAELQHRQVQAMHPGMICGLSNKRMCTCQAQGQRLSQKLLHSAHVCVKLHAESQGGNKDRATLVNSLMPLERALLAQTYLVQDTLSLADIVIALDIKHMVGTNHHISVLIMFTLNCLALFALSAKLQAYLPVVRRKQHIHTETS